MGSFAERLKALRMEHRMTQRELASKLNMSQSTIALYENGDRRPDLDTINKIADIFNVSIDYLFGRDASNISEEDQQRIEFGKRLSLLRKRHRLTQQDMAEKLKITRGAYGLYEQVRREPSIQMIIEIADILGVSLDYLLGRDTPPPPSHDLREVFTRGDLTWEGVPIEADELKTIRDFTSWILRHKVPYRPES